MAIHKEGLVPVPEFSKEHNVSTNNIYVLKKSGSPLIVKIGSNLYVDTDKLYLRKEFRHKIWLKSHEYYYDMMEYFKTETRFAKWIYKYYPDIPYKSWVEFLHFQLFVMPQESIFSVRVPTRMWVFFRLCRVVIRARDRREKRVYKRLPNRDSYEDIYKSRIPIVARRDYYERTTA